VNTPSRIVTPERRADDVGDTALRPQSAVGVVARRRRARTLDLHRGGRKRSAAEALDHVLFVVRPASARPRWRRSVARELGVGFRATSGPVIAKAAISARY